MLAIIYGNNNFMSRNDYAYGCWHGAFSALEWRHNERDGVSNHRSLDCLHNRIFKRRLKKTSKLHVTGICEGNAPVTGGFPP